MKLSLDQLKDLLGNDGYVDHRGKNFVTKCPECGEMEFGVSLDDGHRFGCYRKKACGYTGNIFTLLKRFNKLREYLSEGVIYSRTQDKLINKLLIKKEEINLDLPTVYPPIGWKRVYQNEYLEKRGFTSFSKFKVGVTKIDSKLRDNYVIFLIEVGNDIKGYVARHIASKQEIEEFNRIQKEKGSNEKIVRYRNSETDFSKILGGENELTDKTETVILVEGIFDKEAIDRLLNLDDQEEVKCCCTWKCDISLEQIYKLQLKPNIGNIILLYDPDVINKTKKAAFELENKFQEVQIGFAENGKDPGEFTQEDIDIVFSSLYYPEKFSISKLQRKLLN